MDKRIITYNQAKEYRKSLRLKRYDYSQTGAYFITLCSQNKEYLFAKIFEGNEGNIELNPIGKIASEYWFQIPEHFQNVELDAFIVMPNHIHGIIILSKKRAQNIEPQKNSELLHNEFQHIILQSLGSIIRSYKSSVTHWCHVHGYDHFRWQRNYYEHVIRNEDDLNTIREYILYNPSKWKLDTENPETCKQRRVLLG